MKELRFRAWDGERMRYDVTGFEHGVENEMRGIFLNGEYYKLGEGHGLAFPCAKVMQCTGMKDKGGQYIYEGDIINQDGIYGYKNYLMEMIQVHASDDMGVDMLGYPDVDNACEIVGNIYENSELLGD